MSARQADAEDLARAESGRLLDALNAAAEQACSELPADVSAQLTALLEGDLMTASAADIERQGRAQLTSHVTEAAENWRQDQARRLESGLRAMDERLSAELESELAAIRHAAADLLGIDLALPSPGQSMPGNMRFFYTVHEHVDQAELLAGSVRRWLPGEYGRRLARQRLLGQVAALAGRLVGRARGDLQYQLAEATRQLSADLRRRYAGSADRLAAALSGAPLIRAAAADLRDQQLAELAERERVLRALLGRLAEGASGSGSPQPAPQPA